MSDLSERGARCSEDLEDDLIIRERGKVDEVDDDENDVTNGQYYVRGCPVLSLGERGSVDWQDYILRYLDCRLRHSGNRARVLLTKELCTLLRGCDKRVGDVGTGFQKDLKVLDIGLWEVGTQ